MIIKQFVIIAPELMLTIMTMAGQLFAAFFIKENKTTINAIIVFSVALVFFILQIPSIEMSGFKGSFVINPYTKMFKILILGLMIMNIIIYRDLCEITNKEIKIEFVTLITLSTLGILVSVSSRNFLLLFCGLELQALSAYAMAAFNSSDYKSSEAALKYFVLGALLSCITLFGMSFIYGFSGNLEYSSTFELLTSEKKNIGLIVGIVLLISGILFKFSAAPLHMWTPDVYEGAPIISVTYFATTQKVGVLAILLNIINFVVGDYKQISVDLIRIVAILSMIIGAFGAINQKSLKRLMAYSTILNAGYVLIGVALHNQEGAYAAQLYMIIYVIGAIGFLSCIIALLGARADDATFEDIKGIASTKKTIAAVISLIMFSMIGIPPLAGFFGKYYILYQVILAKEFTLVVIGILSSIISAYYYLKIIRSMYFFEENIESMNRIATQRGLMLVTSASIGFIILFPFFA